MVDSWLIDDGCVIWWCWECENCGFWFIIFEWVEVMLLLVIKKNGVCEEFNCEKVLCGIICLVEKWFVSMEIMMGVVDDVENKVWLLGENEILS